MPDSDGSFTPEQIAKGKEVTAYYVNLDENDPVNQPTDDETKRRSPFSRMRELDFIEPLSKEERDEITKIGEEYQAKYGPEGQ